MKKSSALMLLLLTSFIWGFAFVAQSAASESIGSFTYNGIRMLIGAITLFPFAYKSLKKDLRNKEYTHKLIKGGVLCGLMLGSASYLQQYGIAFTTAGKAGFITSLYILFVPVIGLFLGKKNPRRIWICVATGLIGAYLLSVSNGFSISKGDMYIFLCAILFSFHIIFIDRFAHEINGIEFSMVQFLTAGIVCSIFMPIFETPKLDGIIAATVPLLYSGVLSCGVAYTLQVIGQKYLEPAPATLALSLESVWAAIGGVLLLGERMNTRETIGCIILFISVVIAQLPSKEKA